MAQQTKTAYSYIRWSSAKQTDGDSLRRQKDAAERWLKKNPEYRLDHTLTEETSSYRGRNLDPKYGSLGKFIQEAEMENSQIQPNSALIIERLDRFSRAGAMTAYNAIVRLTDAGMMVVIAEEGLEITSENNNDLKIILPAILSLCLANDESKKRSERISEYWIGHREKVKNNKSILTKQLPCWLYYDEKTASIKADKRKAELIKYIFKKTIDGLGQKALSQELNKNQKHIVEPRNKSDGTKTTPTWNCTFISSILRDRKVLGELQPRKREKSGKYKPTGEPIKNYFPPIISETDFYAAQSAVAQRKREKYAGKSSFINLFTGLVFNGADKQVMNLQSFSLCRDGGTIYRQKRWQSQGKKNGVKESHDLSVDYYSLEKLVLLALTELNEEDYIGNFKPNMERAKLLKKVNWITNRITELSGEYKSIESTKSVAQIRESIEELEQQKTETQKEFDSLASVEMTAFELKDLTKIQKLFSSRNLETDINLRYQIKNIIPTLVKKIIVWPYKRKNRQIGARVAIHLRASRKYRLCVLVKDKKFKNFPVATFYGIKKLPAIAMCDCGLVLFEKTTLDGASNWSNVRDLVGGFCRAGNGQIKKTTIERAKMLLKVRDFCEMELLDSGKGNIDFDDPFGFKPEMKEKIRDSIKKVIDGNTKAD